MESDGNRKVVQNKNKRPWKENCQSNTPSSKLFVSLLYLIKMAQAQPQSHGVNRPNPLGPYNPIRKHSEPEKYVLCIYL